MKKSSIDSQEEARARLKEKMENKRRKQSKSLSKNPKDNDEKSGWSITFKVVRGLIVIFGIIFALVGVFGAATGVGYFARLVEQTKTPNKTEMLAKINDIHGVS
ncbi:hypothetical protein, partial [Virgibacillus salexigens]